MRRKRLLGWALVALGGLFASVVLVSVPATADTSAPATIVVTTTDGTQADIHGPGMQIGGHDTLNPAANAVPAYAGLRKGKFPDGTTAWAYCIHVDAHLVPAGVNTTVLTEQDWDAVSGTLGRVLPKIAYILQAYGGTVDTSAPITNQTNNLKAAAVQSAIWHYSDNFTVDFAPNGMTSQLQTMTNAIVAQADAHVGVGQPAAPTLSLLPNKLNGTPGAQLGPYTVALVGAATATLTVSGDAAAEVRNCATNAVITTAADGDKVCLFADKPGTATLRAATIAIVPSGRIFKDIKPGEEDRQELILAKDKPVPLSASVSGVWTATSTSTTSTTTPTSTTSSTTPASTTTTSTTSSTSTTSTTVQSTSTSTSTTSTTVAPTSTTSTPVAVLPLQITNTPQAPQAAPTEAAPTAVAPETLPLTGRRSVSTVLLALTCLIIGGLLVFFNRPDPALAIAGARPERARTAWRDDLRRQMPWWLRRSRPRV